ncbi:MAG: hypothetical protein B7C24_05525 [Bacteroidetes bacterium 4572_77]|nr:MAG: hypothetical protein B7C24_05525 [Bacteroidetes bacterium 4572_77]
MKKFYRFLLLLIIMVLGNSFLFSQTYDWNTKAGGNSQRNGFSLALGPLLEDGVEPEIYWEGGEYAKYAGKAVIEGDHLLVYRRWQSASQEEAWIIDYNLYTGEERWRVVLPIDTYHNYSKVSAVKDGLVFANRAGGASEPEYIYALDTETGAIVWKSEAQVGECDSESLAFADNGDLIAGDLDYVRRISIEDGSTIWETQRGGASSDGDAANVYGDRVYIWDQTAMGMFITTLDIETGEELYSSDIIGSPGFQQHGFAIGLDGRIYADIQRGNPEMDSLHVFIDNGEAFEKQWSYPNAYTPYGNLGIAADDKSVYTFSRENKLLRLDALTGALLATSEVSLDLDGDDGFMPYIAIGNDGLLYIAVEDWPYYKLSSFTANCELLYEESIEGLRGVALGDSVMVVNGKANIIKAYKGRANSGVGLQEIGLSQHKVYPNPSQGIFYLEDKFEQDDLINIEVFNIEGKVVVSTHIVVYDNNSIRIDLSQQKNGLYLLKTYSKGKNNFQKLLKQ